MNRSRLASRCWRWEPGNAVAQAVLAGEPLPEMAAPVEGARWNGCPERLFTTRNGRAPKRDARPLSLSPTRPHRRRAGPFLLSPPRP
ncbi:MAG: hypothetical protein IPM39_01905 [Chloroflexi bacterium]|nr:hypothetical protein [Chloroflexota bacterium]